MSFNQFQSDAINSKTAFRVEFVDGDILYLVSLDENLANVIIAGPNALALILAGFLWGSCQWLLLLHPGIRRISKVWRISEVGRNPAVGRSRDSFLVMGFMVMAASHWQFLVDAIAFWRHNGEGFREGTVVILSALAAIICTGFPYFLNVALASSNHGAYGIFGTHLGVAPFNWSADSINSISAAVEHVPRGSDYDIFDGSARNLSLVLGQAVEAVGSGSDLGLNVSKEAGCWFGDQFCPNGISETSK